MEGIETDQAPFEIKTIKHCARNRNLVGFGLDDRAAEITLPRHADDAQNALTPAMFGLLAIKHDQLAAWIRFQYLFCAWELLDARLFGRFRP